MPPVIDNPMDLTPTSFGNGGSGDGALRGAGRNAFGQAAANVSAGAMSMRWSALHDAAAAVAALAGVKPEPVGPGMRNFPVMVRDLGGWRRDLAERGVDDLAAIMEPGLAALLAVNARGGDARSAALALWTEFTAARDGLLALVSEGEAQQPLRSA